jgi:hypothetical protein
MPEHVDTGEIQSADGAPVRIRHVEGREPIERQGQIPRTLID